jgi:proton-translocating NADH-quinone oxidoreductase chain N
VIHAFTLHPAVFLGVGALLVYGVARLVSRRNEVLASLTTLVFLVSLLDTWKLSRLVAQDGPLPLAFGDESAMFLAEPGALFVSLCALGLGTLVAIYSGRYLALDRRYEDYYPLLLLLTAGVVSMSMATDLFMLYLCTVVTSAASYVLVALRRHTETATEAGFKYLIMSSMASMLLLAGIGFVYRGSGTLALPIQGAVLTWYGRLGISLILFAYLVKAAVVPGHTWLPDAHGRAPSSISALLSGVIIEAYLFVLLRVALGLSVPALYLGWLLVILATLNMTVGNLLALRQNYGKRLLGYSSIAQLGYMMVALGLGLAYGRPELAAAGFLLMAAHAASKGMAFMCKGVFHMYCHATSLPDLDGMVTRVPLMASCFVVAIAGLAGIPPLAGFSAKLQVLLAAAPQVNLAVALVLALFLLNSLLSLAYYAPLIGRVLRLQEGSARVHVSWWMQAPVLALAGVTLALGLWPSAVLGLARDAATYLLGLGVR